MRKRFVLFFTLTLALAAILAADGAQWNKDAQKLENTLQTLDTLVTVSPFAEDTPGLSVAITNKATQANNELSTLNTSLQNDLATLSPGERQAALTTYATLLMKTADIGAMLTLRSFDQLTLNLATTYNNSYNTYFTLANQYNLTTKRLPIATTVNDRGGWVPV